nr:hypothetical protein [Tanacetum cinerariifolium]
MDLIVVCISTSIKLRFLLPKEEPRGRLASVFPPNIVRPLYGAKLLGGPASVDFNFSNELVMKRVAKKIVLVGTIAQINDPQSLRSALERIVTAFGPSFGDWQ